MSGVTKHRSGNGEVVPHLADLVQSAKKRRQSDFPSSVADAYKAPEELLGQIPEEGK